jgi:hypothetical protein
MGWRAVLNPLTSSHDRLRPGSQPRSDDDVLLYAASTALHRLLAAWLPAPRSPGGPTSSTPLGSLPPRLVNLRGSFRYATISSSSDCRAA